MTRRVESRRTPAEPPCGILPFVLPQFVEDRLGEIEIEHVREAEAVDDDVREFLADRRAVLR